MANWNLDGCCDAEESIFLVLYAVYAVIVLLFSKSVLFKPMKLLSVFVHEMGHAIACWLTGGSVKKIEVYNNEGGVTGYTGGVRFLIIPAGYVGGAFWGGAFVALSGNRVGATVAACFVTATLLLSLCYKPNTMVVFLSLGFSTITLLAIFIEWFVFDPILPYVTLFYGVFVGFYSVRDIYDDLVTRTAEGSDAQACHQLIPCCLPRCVGVQFWILAFIFQVIGIYCALVWLVSTD